MSGRSANQPRRSPDPTVRHRGRAVGATSLSLMRRGRPSSSPGPGHPGHAGHTGHAGAVAAALLGATLFGTTGVAQAFAPAGAHPVAVGAMRLAGGALTLTVVRLVTGGTFAGILQVCRTRAGLLAAAGAAAYQPFFFAGIGQAGVPMGTLVAVGSAPLFTGALAWVVRGERPGRSWLVATAVCLVGLALVTGAGVGAGNLGGILLTAGAGLSIASYMVAAKTLLARGRATLEVTSAAFLLGSCVMVPAAAVLGLGWVATVPGALVAAYLGVATMGLANVLYARGLGGLSAATTATLGLADPLTATVLGAVLLDQRLTPLGLAGLAVLCAGLVLQGTWAARETRAQAATAGR